MSFRGKNCLTFLGGAIVILAMTSYLAWHNLSWVVQNRAFQYVYDRIGSGVNTFIPVTMHTSFGPFPLSPAEKKFLTEGAVTVLSSREAVALAAKSGLQKPLGVTIIANTPGDFAGLSAHRRERLLLDTTRAAIKLKARMMIDCSSADLARLSKEGQISLTLMKKHQIIRAVIFDGGHHLPSLALHPDLIIAPVASLPTGKTITHGYVKDAIPLAEVLHLSQKLGLKTSVTTVPRWPTIAKTKTAMAKLAVKALLINNSKIKVNPIRSNSLRVFYGSRPLVLIGDTALTVVTTQERDLNSMAKLIRITKVKIVYLAVLYPNKINDTKDLKSFAASARTQGVEIHIVTQPYNALDLLRSHLNININSTYKSHTNNEVKQIRKEDDKNG